MVRLLKYVRPLSVALVAVPTFACTRVASPPATAVRVPDEPPLAVTYRVVRSLDGDGIMLSGRMDIGAHDDGRVENVASRGSQQIHLTVRPEADGTLIARVRYEEHSQDGASIRWEPSVRVARGAPGRAEVAGSGWARAIDLTVQ